MSELLYTLKLIPWDRARDCSFSTPSWVTWMFSEHRSCQPDAPRVNSR